MQVTLGRLCIHIPKMSTLGFSDAAMIDVRAREVRSGSEFRIPERVCMEDGEEEKKEETVDGLLLAHA